jgi:lipopolysaccharide export system protein LptC
MKNFFKRNWWIILIVLIGSLLMWLTVILKKNQTIAQEKREILKYENAYLEGQKDAIQGKLKLKRIIKCDSVWVGI